MLLGCCTNLIQFYERLGVENKIRWYDRLTFLEPGGRASFITPSWLPAPLHNAPAFVRAACLDLSDKLSIGMAMAALAPGTPRDTGENFLTWLRRHGQTKRAIERFWNPILVSALNEELDRVSVPYAAQVVRESFLKSAAAGRMGVPTVPLTDLYSVAGDYIIARGGEIRFRSSVESFLSEPAQVKLWCRVRKRALTSSCSPCPLMFYPAFCQRLPPPTRCGKRWRVSRLHPLPAFISGSIARLPILITPFYSTGPFSGCSTNRSCWIGTNRQDRRNGNGSYVELVVSSSKTLVEKSRAEIIELALTELREFFPARARCEPGEIDGDQGSPRDLFTSAGSRRLPSALRDGVAKSLSSRRLDRDWLARHHGRRGKERVSGGGIRGPSRGTTRCFVPGIRFASERIHAAVPVTYPPPPKADTASAASAASLKRCPDTNRILGTIQNVPFSEQWLPGRLKFVASKAIEKRELQIPRSPSPRQTRLRAARNDKCKTTSGTTKVVPSRERSFCPTEVVPSRIAYTAAKADVFPRRFRHR